MYQAMLDLFGLFGISLTQDYVSNLTLAQCIPLIMVGCLSFCVIGAILKAITSLIRLSVGGGGLR